MAMDLVVS